MNDTNLLCGVCHGLCPCATCGNAITPSVTSDSSLVTDPENWDVCCPYCCCYGIDCTCPRIHDAML